MQRTQMTLAFLAMAVVALCWAAAIGTAAEPASRTWLENWQKNNPTWRALHLIGPQPQRMDLTKELVTTLMVPQRMNVLVLEVNYGFGFQSHPELECRGLDKTQTRELAALCRQHGIRLIPLFNCLGHQSWASHTAALLTKYPQFDETPHVPPDNKGIYCREWCPSLPEVDKLVFDLLDELIDAFDADAMHVGMDEVFLIGDDKCPRCRGKDKGELFAGVVNRLHQHLVKDKGVEMLMWGDRLLDASVFKYGSWEASQTGSHRAIDRIPKDIIMCDWHYELADGLPLGAFLPAAGIPRATGAVEEPRRGGGLDPLCPSRRHGQDAGRPLHRLVGGRQRRTSAGSLEGRREFRRRTGNRQTTGNRPPNRRHHSSRTGGTGRQERQRPDKTLTAVMAGLRPNHPADRRSPRVPENFGQIAETLKRWPRR